MVRINRLNLGELSFRAGYSLSIVVAGAISWIGTFVINEFLDISIDSEEYLTNSIPLVTIQTFVGLMALMGIFIVFWLQEYRFRIYESEMRLRIGNSEFDKNYETEITHCGSLLDLELKKIASEKLSRRNEHEKNLRLQTFKKRSYLLIALLSTIVILSYSFLFLENFCLLILEVDSFSNLKLSFDIFIMALCIRTFFLVFQSIIIMIWD